MKPGFVLVIVLLAWPAVSFAQTAIPACEANTFQPCVGDIVGTWSYDGIDCLDLPDMSAQFGPGCTNVTTHAAADVAGTMSFAADGTWASHEVTNMRMTFVVPQTCLPTGATCDAFANPLATVTTEADGCHLVITQADTKDEAGTYVVTGHTAVMTDGEEPTDVDTVNFCVQGDTSTVEIVDESGVRAIFTNTRVP